MFDIVEAFRHNGRLPHTLLDIGCGPCEEGERILSDGIFLTGIDQDGETIREVQKRLPTARFVTADAARWLPVQDRKYKAVLIRRPDVIFRSANWHQIFQLLPHILYQNSRVVVTTPGRSEAGICEKWLREMAGTVKRSRIDMTEEEFMITAENFKRTDQKESSQNNLICNLAWEDEEPHMVCDLRKGRCTIISDDEKEKKQG